MTVDQGPTDQDRAGPGGYWGARLLTELGDPQDPTNVSFPFLRRIKRDHMVAMGLHFIETPIIKAPFYYEDDGRGQVAAFADNLIRPIYGDLLLTLLRMVWAGFSPGVKNFETVNPAWTYLVDGEPKRVWDQPGVDALIYKPVTPLKPENSRPVWLNGNFNGIAYDTRYGGMGYFMLDGNQKPEIDLLHAFWAVHNQASEDGNPWGFSRIAHCAPIFHMYRYIWTLLGRAFENNADPGPVVRYPRDDMPTVDANGTIVKNVDVALKIARRRRSGSSVALPSEPYTDFQDKPTGIKRWDIEYPKAATDFDQIMKFLGFLESAKLRALWLPDQGLVEGQGGSSSRNVATEFGKQRDDSQVILMQQLDDVIDETFVKPAIAMNFPWYEGKLVKKTLGPGQDEEDFVRQVMQLVGQQDYTAFGVDVQKIAETKGVPMLDPAAMKRVREEAAQRASVSPTPPVTPNQGRRAHVTQTGFDRQTDQPIMSYHEIGGTIEFSADDNFVAGLPKTDVFSDAKVVASARALRNTSSAFLTWAYGDFARYLGKQKTLSLDTLADEVVAELLAEGLELDDQARAQKVADKLIAGWRPRVEKIAEFSKKSRSIIGRVFDRTASLQLSRLGSKVKASSSIQGAAADWLDGRGAELVTGILETTRQQLAGVLADGVRSGRTVKEIAADVREHFDQFPSARATAIARTEVSEAFNYATVSSGIDAGLSRCQLVDGTRDQCRTRNGKIMSLTDALNERLNHTNCQLVIRLLPNASSKLEVRHEALDGVRARYDAATETILLSPDLSEDERIAYLLALGERLSVVEQAVPA